MNRDSGSQRVRRTIRGGRTDPRNAPFMVAWVAERRNARIESYAARRSAAGKPFKVMMAACMRKLLTIPNVMLKPRTRWNDNLVLGARK
jgi:transposase